MSLERPLSQPLKPRGAALGAQGDAAMIHFPLLEICYPFIWSSEAAWYPCVKLLKREMLSYYKSVYIVKTIWTLQSIYLAVKGTTGSFSKQKVFT